MFQASHPRGFGGPAIGPLNGGHGGLHRRVPRRRRGARRADRGTGASARPGPLGRRLVASVVLALLACPMAQAASIALAGGYGEDTNVWGVAVAWDAVQPLLVRESWRAVGRLEVDVMELRSRGTGTAGYRSVGTMGATPGVRIERPGDAYAPFVEAGFGFNFLTHTEMYGGKRYGVAFQFGEFVGVGIRVGPEGAGEIGVRLQHLSNGEIKQPNTGITFAVLRLAYHY
jgi:lipid A 3-O-deacylase